MKVLVVGTGAREHAICDALIKDDVELYAYMSKNNPGISKISTFKKGDEGEVDEVAKFAKENEIELAVIGPEAPLGKGIVNALEAVGVPCVGPAQESARIETDKSFMRNGVKIVGDHLKDNQDAKAYAKEVMDNAMGGFAQVIIEEKVVGEEFTIQAFCDGENLAPMPAAQDHPHAFENDQGLITGGMGSYSDVDGLLPFLSREDYDEAVDIMKETLKAIAKETTPYKGILYGQFMLSKEGPKLIEYNARFGDPEAMNVLPLLKTPMIDICKDIVEGKLGDVEFEDLASVCKYIVPDGYPDTPHAGELIDVDEEAIEALGAKVFYAAVSEEEDGIHLSGSRALGIVAQGKTIDEAEKIAEEACQLVGGNVYHRRDVGTQALIQKRIDHMEAIRNE